MKSDTRRAEAESKQIFVISPIAKPDADGFDYTELFLNEIVIPAAMDADGFAAPVRADRMAAHGSITAKIVATIIQSDVCIADLTDRSPNVMYEVAIAHAADKPVILLQQEAGGPPFDFQDERVIQYSTRADEANRARDQLTQFLNNINHEKEDSHLDRTLHPVRTIFRDIQVVSEASDPQRTMLEGLNALTQSFQHLQAEVTNLRRHNDFLSHTRQRTPRGETDLDELIVSVLKHPRLSNEAREHFRNVISSIRAGNVPSRHLDWILSSLMQGKTEIAEAEIRKIPPF